MWASVIGALGQIINSGIQAGSSASMTKKGYHYQSNLLNRQQKFAKEMASNAYQMTKKDLLNSGYNPLMAVTNGTNMQSGGTAPSVSTSNGINPNLNFSELATNAEQRKLLKKQQDQVDAETQRTNAETEKLKLDTVYRGLENKTFGERFFNEMKEAVSRAAKNNAATAKEISEKALIDETNPNQGKVKVGPIEISGNTPRKNNNNQNYEWRWRIVQEQKNGKTYNVRERYKYYYN